MRIPRGFRMAGVHCGIKSSAGAEDLTLIVADEPAVTAGVYTQNLIFAAPVGLDRERTPADNIRVIVANSGNANACTGQRGDEDAREMTRLAAEAVGGTAEQALVLSTGIIGQFLPMERIARGIADASNQLGTTDDHFVSAAKGITTTDRSHKVAGRELSLASGPAQITGMAKGAGMIGPRMATMLAVITTDVRLTVADAQRLLSEAADDSFNCISVEGHMSTNDTVFLMASGAAAAAPLSGDDLETFRVGLNAVCVELARMIPDDGEGATHLITIDVRGCRSRDDARRIATTVGSSALVKTAVTGADPNWGRIVSAAGYAGVEFDPAALQLRLNGTLLYRRGEPVEFDEAAVSQSVRENRETRIELDLAGGDASIRCWTSDLTVDYVRFNSEYHT